MNKELQDKFVSFVQDMRDSTRHYAILGVGHPLNQGMIFKEATELLKQASEQGRDEGKNGTDE